MYTFDSDLFSDIFKDAYGFRPRGHRFYEAETTDDERQVIWDYTVQDAEHAIELERQRQLVAVNEFEADIMNTMDVCNCSRGRAIFFCVQSLNPDEVDLRYGGEWVCYELGLPFEMAEVFDSACEELRAAYA